MVHIKTYVKPTLLYQYWPLGICKPTNGRAKAEPGIMKRALSATEQHFVLCPTYAAMNDPMEGLCASSRKLRERSDYNEVVRDVRNEKIGITSFSETWDNELMLAHYADGFGGICVTYSCATLTRRLSNEYSLAHIARGDRPFNLKLPSRFRRKFGARSRK